MTTEITPFLFTGLSSGMHTISVFKDGYRADSLEKTVFVTAEKQTNVNFILQQIRDLGHLQVNSNPDRATIFLDGAATGKITPDELLAEPGEHLIELNKNGFVVFSKTLLVQVDSLYAISPDLSPQTRVLLESFANTSCAPCVDAGKVLDQFTLSHPTENYAIIEYSGNWPNPNDIFYWQAPEDNNQRLINYNVLSLPALRIDGNQNPDPKNYDDVNNHFSEAFRNTTGDPAISIEKDLRGDSLSVRIDIYYENPGQYSPNLRLFVALTENDIHFDEAPGGNGLTDFNYVFRGFLSQSQGNSVHSQSSEETTSFVTPWGEWNYNNTHVVSFLQDINTQKIYQVSIN